MVKSVVWFGFSLGVELHCAEMAGVFAPPCREPREVTLLSI